MQKPKQAHQLSSEEVAKLAIAALEDVKAKDIVTIDVRGKTSVTDFMVIASGTSSRHVKSMANEVLEKVKEQGVRPLGSEGMDTGEWALLDLGDVVVHVMQVATREFYDLERLWQGAEQSRAQHTRNSSARPSRCACAHAFDRRGLADAAVGGGRLAGICQASAAELALELVEIPLTTRGKNADVARLIRQEGEAMLSKVQPGERIVTLEVQGKPWSTEQLAVELDRWRLDARTVNLMVGGPEGLAPEVCARSEQRWSLSPLTLPHPLVRILLGEQIYRAWTVLSGHPYHK